MDIFIVGGAGFIGYHLVHHLLTESDDVVAVFDRELHQNIKKINSSRLNLIEGDIFDAPLLERSLLDFDPDIVVHLAAIHFLPFCHRHPKPTWRTNVDGTANLVKSLDRLHHTCHLIFASSAAVYADQIYSASEDSKTAPGEIYGQSKLAAEDIIWKTKSKNIRFSILRLFNVYGPLDRTLHVIPAIISQLRQRGSVRVGNLDVIRDYVYVTDVVRAVETIINAESSEDRLYNIGTGRGHSVRQIIETIEGLLGKDIEIVSEARLRRSSDRAALVADVSKIGHELGWQPLVTLREGLRPMLKKEGSCK